MVVHVDWINSKSAAIWAALRLAVRESWFEVTPFVKVSESVCFLRYVFGYSGV